MGGGGGNPCPTYHADDATVTLTAVNSDRYTFEHWGGACAGQNAVCVIPGFSADTDVIATFNGP
jgi:hypothetical protein